MTRLLANKVIATLVTNGFEEKEFVAPYTALKNEGARVLIVSPCDGEVRSWSGTRWEKSFPVDKHLNSALCMDFDGLLLPSLASSQDFLQTNSNAVKFIGDFLKIGKPVAAINLAPAMLTDTGRLKGRTVSSHISVRTRLQDAGARWVSQEVVSDRGLVTGCPQDMAYFTSAMIQVFHREIDHYHAGWGT